MGNYKMCDVLKKAGHREKPTKFWASRGKDTFDCYIV